MMDEIDEKEVQRRAAASALIREVVELQSDLDTSQKTLDRIRAGSIELYEELDKIRDDGK